MTISANVRHLGSGSKRIVEVLSYLTSAPFHAHLAAVQHCVLPPRHRLSSSDEGERRGSNASRRGHSFRGAARIGWSLPGPVRGAEGWWVTDRGYAVPLPPEGNESEGAALPTVRKGRTSADNCVRTPDEHIAIGAHQPGVLTSVSHPVQVCAGFAARSAAPRAERYPGREVRVAGTSGSA